VRAAITLRERLLELGGGVAHAERRRRIDLDVRVLVIGAELVRCERGARDYGARSDRPRGCAPGPLALTDEFPMFASSTSNVSASRT